LRYGHERAERGLASVKKKLYARARIGGIEMDQDVLNPLTILTLASSWEAKLRDINICDISKIEKHGKVRT
jgi:hypothetical protein